MQTSISCPCVVRKAFVFLWQWYLRTPSQHRIAVANRTPRSLRNSPALRMPDVIRCARNPHADEPMHGMVNGGIRAIVATVLTFYIMVAMIAKVSLIAG